MLSAQAATELRDPLGELPELVHKRVTFVGSMSELAPGPLECVILADPGPEQPISQQVSAIADLLGSEGRLLTSLSFGPSAAGSSSFSIDTLPECLEALPVQHLESELVGATGSEMVSWQASWATSPSDSTEFWACLMQAVLMAADRLATTAGELSSLKERLFAELKKAKGEAEADRGIRPKETLPVSPMAFDPSNQAAVPTPGGISPIGYRRVVGGRLAVVGSLVGGREGVDDLLGLLGELAVSPGVDLFGSVHGVRLPAGMSVFAGHLDPLLVERLRPYGGVVDHPALHQTVTGRAETLMTLATAGVPLAASQIGDQLEQLIGEEMATLLTSVQITDLTDPEARDRLSVRLRRISLHQGSQTSTWRDLAGSLDITVAPLPTISILLASNRPAFLDHALEQVRAQTYPETELVLILHGEGFSITDSQIQEKYDRPLKILRIPSATVYGEALNRGTAASTGTLIAKMDDDDWYSKHHLWDLVHAINYSGADLVGKAAEFVYLEELDLTIRRMVEGSETYGNRNLAGGTFLIRSETLHHIGGWRRVPRHVDQALLDDLTRGGRLLYRAMGHGYILHRRPTGHTWNATLDYFLDQSDSQFRGLALEESLVLA